MTSPNRKTADEHRAEAIARARLRRMRGKGVYPPPPTVGRAARNVTRSQLKGTGATLGALRDRWPDIAGEKLAHICRPEKMSGRKGARTLTLRVLPAAAPLVQHQSETLRQRLSVAAGGDIVRLKLVQGTFLMNRPTSKASPRHLTQVEETWLDHEVRRIEHPALRNALRRLGAALLRDDPSDADA